MASDGFDRLWQFVGGFFGILFLLSLIIGSMVGFGFTLFLLFVLLVALGVSVFNIFSSKAEAIKSGSSNTLAGFCRIISWNPTEGVYFLRNKLPEFSDDNPNDGGGIRAIFPLFGQEMVCLVPLEVQTLNFQDNEVLTKEFLPLKIKGTIYWKILDIGQFYTNVSTEVHSIDNRGHHDVKTYKNAQMNTADTWLRAMAEEKTRAAVAGMGTGLLMADRLSAEVEGAPLKDSSLYANKAESSGDYRTVTDSLADALTVAVNNGVNHYGIFVERIALQEVNLPPEIYAAAVVACQASYGQINARADALAKQMSLRAEVDVLGADVVGLREVAKNIPALAFQDVLGPTFAKLAASLSKNVALPKA